MTITKLQNEVNKALKKGNCKVSCPVSINNRLTRTLGRAIFTRQGGRWTSVRIEFSGSMIKNVTEASIMEVLLHEVAHVVANYRTGWNEGHNNIFKMVCHELGTYNDGCTTTLEYKNNVKPTFRFEVLCPNCGIIGKYQRMGKTLKVIDRCRCAKCGNNNLTLKENW